MKYFKMERLEAKLLATLHDTARIAKAIKSTKLLSSYKVPDAPLGGLTVAVQSKNFDYLEYLLEISEEKPFPIRCSGDIEVYNRAGINDNVTSFLQLKGFIVVRTYPDQKAYEERT